MTIGEDVPKSAAIILKLNRNKKMEQIK